MRKRPGSSAKLGLPHCKQQQCSGVWDGRAEAGTLQVAEMGVQSQQWGNSVGTMSLGANLCWGKTAGLKVPSVSALCSYCSPIISSFFPVLQSSAASLTSQQHKLCEGTDLGIPSPCRGTHPQPCDWMQQVVLCPPLSQHLCKQPNSVVKCRPVAAQYQIIYCPCLLHIFLHKNNEIREMHKISVNSTFAHAE